MHRSLRVLQPAVSAVGKTADISQSAAKLGAPHLVPGLLNTPRDHQNVIVPGVPTLKPQSSTLDAGFAKHLNHPLEKAYFELSQGGMIRYDHKQMLGVQKLARVYDEVVANPGRASIPVIPKKAASTEKSFLPPNPVTFVFSLLDTLAKGNSSGGALEVAEQDFTAPKGLYLYGGGGCGKTMLLDLFHRSLPPEFPVRRLDWHVFAREALQHIAEAPEDVCSYEHVAALISKKCKVLLLDKILITHLKEALLVRELFHQLWLRGTTIIATSSYKHEELYPGNQTCNVFGEAVPELMSQMPLHDMEETIDFRTEDDKDGDNFFDSVSAETTKKMDAAFDEHGGRERSMWLPVPGQGRSLHIERASSDGSAVRFTFHELCKRPLGRDGYAALAEKFSTVFVYGVPVLASKDKVGLQRFVQLIDILYDMKVVLYVQSDGDIESIYKVPVGTTGDDLRAWKRCCAMLHEMRTKKYTEVASVMRPHLVQDRAFLL